MKTLDQRHSTTLLKTVRDFKLERLHQVTANLAKFDDELDENDFESLEKNEVSFI